MKLEMKERKEIAFVFINAGIYISSSASICTSFTSINSSSKVIFDVPQFTGC